MDTIRRDSCVVSSGLWTGVRGQWPLVEHEEGRMDTGRELSMGLTPDFLLGLFHYHVNWVRQVSGLNENDARKRVVALLRTGRIGYLDEAGHKRTLPSDALHWVNAHAS
ncbi:MAG: hypothetical protein G8237_01225 [Magnetococcales bacterium]|nr:hypothetical protein [Magnetococcales bacterium]NGZ04958.1 hypothetical protein [Magnetococcales bacterium]